MKILPLICPLLFLSACADKNAATTDTFKTAVQRYLDKAPKLACEQGYQTFQNLPLRLSPDAAAKVFGESLKLGFVRQVTEVAGSVVQVSVTHRLNEQTGQGTLGTFCPGPLAVVSVDAFSRPAQTFGITSSQVQTTVRYQHRPAWASDPLFLKEAAISLGGQQRLTAATHQRTFVAVLNSSGWVVTGQ